MVDLIEWMRNFNKSPSRHPILSFTSFDMQTAKVAAKKAVDYLKKAAPDQAGVASAAYIEAQDSKERAHERALAVLRLFDAHRLEMARASSEEDWLDGRQAANIVVQAITSSLPGTNDDYRDEAMAGNVEWLAGQAYPNEKIVLWAHNSHIGCIKGEYGPKPMGAWLREHYGKQFYAVGFAYRRGELRAIGTKNGDLGPVEAHAVPPSPEGSGDAVLSGAGVPLFFLDMSRMPDGPLARWLAETHLFHNSGWNWSLDDAEMNFAPGALSKKFDAVIFVEEGHASRPMQ
jgi:erythromycin esterase